MAIFGQSPWGVGEGGSDGIPPGISYSPGTGTTIASDQAIQIDITDNEAIASLFVAIEFPSGIVEVVHDGTAFTPRYAGGTFVGGGAAVSLQVSRPGGWQEAPKFKTYATDASGNSATASAQYVLEAAESPADCPAEDELDPFLASEGLRTAVMISLFSDRRAAPDAEIPAGDGDRRGWWADEFSEPEGDKIGSRLWLLDRSTAAGNVTRRAEEMMREALAWMLEDRVASKVEATAAIDGQQLDLYVTIHRPHADPVSYRFDHVWEAEAAQLPAISLWDAVA